MNNFKTGGYCSKENCKCWEQMSNSIPSATIDTKPIVIRRFCDEDLDNCWAYYKSYLVDILNGDYDLETAREDLGGLIGSEFDLRSKNGV